MEEAQDKVAIVTGANSGIGVYTTLGLLNRGYHVIMACRNLIACEQARQQILEESSNPKSDLLECMEVDLSSFSSTRLFINNFKAKSLPLSLLVNNAGLYSPNFSLTKDNFEQDFQTNYLSQFYLTLSLLPILKSAATAKIINVSSRAHKFCSLDLSKYVPGLVWTGYFNSYATYGTSKLMQIMFTYELDKRLKEANINNVSVNALHPGVVGTGIWRTLPSFMKPLVGLLSKYVLLTPQQGAETTLLVADLENVSGKFYSEKKLTETSKVSYQSQQWNELWEFSANVIPWEEGEKERVMSEWKS